MARPALTSTYVDTDDRRLARGGIRLRRRQPAGERAEWRLALPREGDRLELRWEAADEHVPAEIEQLLVAHTRGRPLALTGAPQRPRRPRTGADAAGSSAAALQAVLRAQYEQILLHDPGTRLGRDAEELHDHRVAVRRLRAMLRAGRPMLDRPWADDLRRVLRRAGQALAQVRDLDVMLADVQEIARGLPEPERTGAAEIADVLRDRRDAAQVELAVELGEAWYVSLLNRLELAVEAPHIERSRPLAKVVRKEHRRARGLVRDLPRRPSDTDLHAVRKAVKRGRYAAELADAAGIAGMRAYVKRAKQVQDVLGDHQDAVVAAEALERLEERLETVAAVRAAEALRDAYAERRRRARSAFPRVWKRLEKRAP